MMKLGPCAAGVVKVYDHGTCRGRHFICMEYVPGGTLSAYLPRLFYHPAEAARIVAEVAEAAHGLHQQGLIHRDVKPANILVQPPAGAAVEDFPLTEAVPLLTDFGLVKRLENSGATRTGEILGTPDYMAPEMIRSSKDAAPAADVYSPGATLYACLTMRPLPS